MFNTSDCIIFQSQLIAKSTFDATNLIRILSTLANNKSVHITTLDELKDFILSLELKDVEIESLLLFLIENKSAFLESFHHISVFDKFLSGNKAISSFSSSVILSFLQNTLINKIPFIVRERLDVIALINLLHTHLPDDLRLEFFYSFSTQTIQALFKPYKLTSKTVLNQSKKQICEELTTLRQQIPSTYEPDYDAIEEMIGDIFYEWSRANIDEAYIKRVQGWLNTIANYEYLQKQYIFRKNQYNANVQNTTDRLKRVALVDVDLTLINYDTQQKQIYNLALIEKLLRHGLKDIFLFTDMPCCAELIIYRENIILFLQKQGLRVHGVLTPTDLIADLTENDFRILTELSFGEVPPSQLFIGDPLVQAIYQRFINEHFPPTCGLTYKAELIHMHEAIKSQSFLSSNSVSMMSQFRRIENRPSVLIRKNLMQNLWTVIRYIEHFQAQRANRTPSHIKLHVFKQFLKWHTHIQKIIVFDDRPEVINSINNYIKQKKDAISTHVQTNRVEFASIADYTHNYIPFIYRPESTNSSSTSSSSASSVSFQSDSSSGFSNNFT